MSYLTLPGGIPDFSKAVISFWVRIPLESMKAAYDQIDVGATDVQVYNNFAPELGDDPINFDTYTISPVLNGIIPFVTFGNPSMQGFFVHGFWQNLASYTHTYQDENGDVFPPNETQMGDYQSQHGPDYPLDPCSIGLDVYNYDSEPGGGVLRINLQYAAHGNGSWIRWDNANISCDPLLVNWYGLAPPGILYTDHLGKTAAVWGPTTPFTSTWTAGDVTGLTLDSQLDNFNVEVGALAPDVWHHVLISFDLSGAINASGTLGPNPPPPGTKGSLTSGCKMWVAIDDKNYEGIDLHGNTGEYFGLDKNEVMTGNSERAIFNNPDDFTVSGGPFVVENIGVHSGGGYVWEEIHQGCGTPSYSWTPPPIQSSGFPLGIPAAPKFVDKIYRIEMAEFQMWIGVTFDTGIEKNRRAFVNANGEPVDPTKGPNDDPEGPAPAEKLLGKKPDVLLHGADNWKEGANTGTTGIKIETDGSITKLPGGQFNPTGGIEEYKPDPSLEDGTA